MGKLSEIKKTYFASQAFLSDGWANNVRIGIDEKGLIQSIKKDQKPHSGDEQVGIIVPGIPNLHSHTFQRKMAGNVQHKGKIEGEASATNNFWVWRKDMYEYANTLEPEAIKRLYKRTFQEMLEAGYTSVCEFHYIHHDLDGKKYQSETLISDMIIEAAQEAKMPITLLPTFYAHSGFGGLEPLPEQRRFITSKEDYIAMVEQLQERYKFCPNVKIGMSLHSLRAVTPEEIEFILNSDIVQKGNFPIHMHLAEQPAEIEACQKWTMEQSGKALRPAEWFLDNVLEKKGADDKPIVDPKRFTLIHETHLTPEEAKRLAKSGSVAGYCPSTEGDLGDGIPLSKEYIEDEGALGVGSDSNRDIDPLAELRTLADDQNKKHGTRVTLAVHHSSLGRELYEGAVKGGNRASGQNAGLLETDKRADFLVLDSKHPTLNNFDDAIDGSPKTLKQGDTVFDSLVLTKNGSSPIKDVVIAGQYVVKNRLHVNNSQSRSSESSREKLKEIIAEIEKAEEEVARDRQEWHNRAWGTYPPLSTNSYLALQLQLQFFQNLQLLQSHHQSSQPAMPYTPKSDFGNLGLSDWTSKVSRSTGPMPTLGGWTASLAHSNGSSPSATRVTS